MDQEQVGATPAGEPEQASGFAQSVSGEQVQFGPGFAVTVQGGQDVSMSQAGALGVVAGQNMDLSYGGGVVQVAGGDMKITNGGSQMMVVGGDLDVTNGGAQVILAGGDVAVTNGGGVLLAGQQVTAQKGFFGIAITPQLNLSDDSRVLLDTPRAAIFGLAFGAVFGLLSLLFRRK
jgi:hypothetical protein